MQARTIFAAGDMDHGTIRRISRQRIVYKRLQPHSNQNEAGVHDVRSLIIIEVNRQHAKRIA